jgi:hypothetical protein
MLAAQTQKRADKAMAAVSVIITAPRPVAVIGKMLDHKVEQLHGLSDLSFRHWLECSRSEVTAEPYHRPPQSAFPRAYGKATGSAKLGSLFLTLPTRTLTGHAIMLSEG